MKVIFDKNLESEFEVIGKDYYENIADSGSSMTIVYRCNPDIGEEVPDYDDLYGKEFSTVDVQTDCGIPIAVQGHYSRISAVNVAYNDTQKIYSVNIMVQ